VHACTAAHVFRHTSTSHEVESSESFSSLSTPEHIIPSQIGVRQASRNGPGERRHVLIREVVVGAEMIRILVKEVSCAKSVGLGCTANDKIGTAAVNVEAELMPSFRRQP
jgi:hypothetical protein